MQKALVVTVVGANRPGIVERLAAVVAEHEGSWLDSHMADLAGQFAGIVQVEVDAARHRGLADSLGELAAEGLAVTLADGLPASRPARQISLELTGLDHPGIVRDIAAALARCGVSVESLETERTSGSMSGEMLFVARADLALPDGLTLDALDAALQDVSAGLMVDVALDPIA